MEKIGKEVLSVKEALCLGYYSGKGSSPFSFILPEADNSFFFNKQKNCLKLRNKKSHVVNESYFNYN